MATFKMTPSGTKKPGRVEIGAVKSVAAQRKWLTQAMSVTTYSDPTTLPVPPVLLKSSEQARRHWERERAKQKISQTKQEFNTPPHRADMAYYMSGRSVKIKVKEAQENMELERLKSMFKITHEEEEESTGREGPVAVYQVNLDTPKEESGQIRLQIDQGNSESEERIQSRDERAQSRDSSEHQSQRTRTAEGDDEGIEADVLDSPTFNEQVQLQSLAGRSSGRKSAQFSLAIPSPDHPQPSIQAQLVVLGGDLSDTETA